MPGFYFLLQNRNRNFRTRMLHIPVEQKNTDHDKSFIFWSGESTYMDIIATVIMIIIAVVICAVLFFFLRNGLKLLINAVCGVVILFIVSWLNLAPIGDLSIAQVIVCAVGGILGAALLIILSFFGIII